MMVEPISFYSCGDNKEIEEASLLLERYLGKANVLRDEPLFKHNTWRVGGKAFLFAIVNTFSELRKSFRVILEKGIPFFVIGKGSNLLVSDNGFKGVVLKLGKDFSKSEVKDGLIKAGAAVPLPTLVNLALKNSLAGLSFAAGIPGSFGGALVLNAGAFGGCIGDVVESVTVYDFKEGLKLLKRREIYFGYRESSLSSFPVVLEGVLRLSYGDPIKLKAEMERFFRKRKKTQPLGYPTAGSVFKNPSGKSAAELIEQAGLKGLKRGGAQISPLHANFIINLGEARACDIFSLIFEAQRKVYEKFGIILEPEVNFLGEFDKELLSGGDDEQS